MQIMSILQCMVTLNSPEHHKSLPDPSPAQKKLGMVWESFWEGLEDLWAWGLDPGPGPSGRVLRQSWVLP